MSSNALISLAPDPIVPPPISQILLPTYKSLNWKTGKVTTECQARGFHGAESMSFSQVPETQSYSLGVRSIITKIVWIYIPSACIFHASFLDSPSHPPNTYRNSCRDSLPIVVLVIMDWVTHACPTRADQSAFP